MMCRIRLPQLRNDDRSLPGCRYVVECIGVVNWANMTGTNFLFEEDAGTQDGGMILDSVDEYLKRSVSKDTKHLIIVSDNGSTVKNYQMLAWAQSLVDTGAYPEVTLLYLVEDHGKVDVRFPHT